MIKNKLNKKGFVLIETMIVMSVISIGLVYIYANYTNLMNTSGKVNYYDNVGDLYIAYYAYTINGKFTEEEKKNAIIVNDSNPELSNLGIKKIYYLSSGEATTSALSENLLKYDGTTINYINSIKNKVETLNCSEPCLTIVKIERDGKYYFAKYEAYNNL